MPMMTTTRRPSSSRRLLAPPAPRLARERRRRERRRRHRPNAHRVEHSRRDSGRMRPTARMRARALAPLDGSGLVKVPTRAHAAGPPPMRARRRRPARRRATRRLSTPRGSTRRDGTAPARSRDAGVRARRRWVRLRPRTRDAGDGQGWERVRHPQLRRPRQLYSTTRETAGRSSTGHLSSGAVGDPGLAAEQGGEGEGDLRQHAKECVVSRVAEDARAADV